MSRQRAAIVVLSVLLPVVAVGVAVLARGGDDQPAPLPVLAGGGEEAMAADAATRLAFGFVSYEAGPDLPALDGSARAYRLEPVGEDAVRSVADAFGLADAIEDDGSGGWTAVDGNRTLSVYPDTLSWSYYAADAMSDAGSGGGSSGCAGPDCSVSSEPVTTVPPLEPPPEPPPLERPADLPSREDAETIARDVLVEIGVPIEGAQVQAYDNTLSWSFTFDPVVDGTPTYGYSNSVSIGAGGVVVDGYGVLGDPAAADEYPLVGTAAAVDRLNRGEAFGPSLAATATLETAVADSEPPASHTTVPLTTETTACVDVEPRPSACGDPALPTDPTLFCPPEGLGAPTTFYRDPACDKVEPLPPELVPPPTVMEPESVVVTLTDAEVVLAFLPAIDGTGGWLVPAYRFTTDGGGFEVALAVADEFLAGADGESPDDTGTGDTGTVDTGSVEPGSGSQPPCAPSVEDDGSGTTHTVYFCEPPGTGIDPLPPASDLETRPTVAPDSATN